MKKIKLTNFNNDRIYTKDSIDNLIKKQSEFGVYGSINPDSTDILLKNISHTIKNIEIYDDGIYGEIQFLDTPNGNLIKKIGLDYLSISERCFGHYDQDTNKVIVDKIIGYNLIGDVDLLSIRRKKIEKIKKIIKYNNGNK